MSLSTAHSARVFSAGGHCFTWFEVVEWARIRGEWAVLRDRVAALLAINHSRWHLTNWQSSPKSASVSARTYCASQYWLRRSPTTRSTGPG
ncbi:MAG: hypothetical protein QOH91_3263 [Mycobacterium sp.]|nr:hypothetical protein [Mycobacterium sp.]